MPPPPTLGLKIDCFGLLEYVSLRNFSLIFGGECKFVVFWGPGWGVHTRFFIVEMNLTKDCRETIACNLGRKDIKNLEPF